jgi:hypothetical protein
MGGSADVRPLLEKLKKIDSENLPHAWESHKELLRSEFSKHQDYAKNEVDKVTSDPSILTGIQTIFSQLIGKGSQSGSSSDTSLTTLSKSPNIVDIIENAARTERKSFLIEQIKNKSKMEQLQKEHELKIREHLEANKKKKLKLIDYLMGAGQIEPVSAEVVETSV